MDHASLSALGAPAAGVVEPAKPRLKAIDRQQMRLHPVEVERLVEPDHAVRAIWELIGAERPGRVLRPDQGSRRSGRT